MGFSFPPRKKHVPHALSENENDTEREDNESTSVGLVAVRHYWCAMKKFMSFDARARIRHNMKRRDQ